MVSEEEDSIRMNRRKLSWSEREKNKMRERRRRAIAGKIYAGLRAQGNYNLSKHCDNNEILKAICVEAGWTVEEDGTIYRKGCKLPPPGDGAGSSTTRNTPFYSSSQILTSFQPIPSSSSLQTPVPFDSNINSPILCTPNVPFPPPHLWMSSSAPVTPLLESPKPSSSSIEPFYSAASSTPFTPTTQCDEYAQWMKFQGFSAPTFNFIGTAAAAADRVQEEMSKSDAGEGGQVKPWVGERIHEVAVDDDLELTLTTGAKSSTT